MKNSTFEKLLKIYKESDDGLTDVSKITGLPRYEVVNLLKLDIDPPMANMILYDMMREGKLPKINKNGFYIDNMTGAWYIELKRPINEKYHAVQYGIATPYWDGNPILPIDTEWVLINSNSDGEKVEEIEGQLYESFDTPKQFNSVESLLEWYRDFYIPKVNEVLDLHFNEILSNSELLIP